jgi:glutamate-1-semialdehyde 2,1-aminomutase
MPERSLAERELLEKARRYFPGGTSGNFRFPEALDFLIRKGQGAHVWDASGRRYIDWLMGSGPLVLGHAHSAVVEAVSTALERGSTYFANNEQAVLLAEELVRAFPCAEQVRFTTSGTDACLQCLRVARAYRQRDKIVKFEGGYHGMSDYGLMSVSSSSTPDFPQPVPCSGGLPRAIEDTVLIAPFNDLEITSQLIERHADELAAVIVEPMQRLLTPVPGFLAGLREVTKRHGVVLIFDEVVTGFRLAYGGAQERYGVVPDLCAIGKIMGGGLPLAGVLGRKNIMAMYDPDVATPENYVQQIGTLNGNPIACAAGLATLAELRKDGAYGRLRSVGRRLRQGLVTVCNDHDIAVQSCGEDALFDVFFSEHPVQNYRDQLLADSDRAARFNTGLLEQGILKFWPQKFYPSLAHTDEDIEETVSVMAQVMSRLRAD